MKNTFYLILFMLMFSSCLQKGYILFVDKKEELIATERIKNFIRSNPHPSIVLRVPKTTLDVTQSDPNAYVYSAIEKELVLAGFNLKDRGLFNQVLNSQSGLEYSKITELTGTDLILELVKIDNKVPFKTNKAYTKDGKLKNLNNISYTRYGASIEFKLIMVHNNEFGGSYWFSFPPCTEQKIYQCQCQVPYKYSSKFYPDYVVDFCDGRTYEVIPQEEFEAFVRSGVKKVIAAIR